MERKKVKRKEVEVSEQDIMLILGFMQADMIFRSIWGKGIIRSFSDIYGKKWKKEGYAFDLALDRALERAYKRADETFRKVR